MFLTKKQKKILSFITKLTAKSEPETYKKKETLVNVSNKKIEKNTNFHYKTYR